MARNVARQQGQEIRHFTTAVFDRVDLPHSFRDGPPAKDHPLYYYRPWKTILCRTIADSGRSYYFRGDHAQTIPTLWHLELTTIKRCINWFIEDEHVPTDCRIRLPLAKPTGTDTYCWRPEEVKAILEHCRKTAELQWLALESHDSHRARCVEGSRSACRAASNVARREPRIPATLAS